jgi:eukaryotic-like serine/threonine-protein kinase
VKRCPICQRDFADHYTFCDQDGASLTTLSLPASLLVRAADDTQHEIALTATPATIGKALDNNIVLKDSAASRRHAQIEWQTDHYVVKDLGSLNGIFVNGQRVGAEGHALKDGDEISLGRSVLIFQGRPVAPSSPPNAAPLPPPPAVPPLKPRPSSPASPPPLPSPPNFRVAPTGELLANAASSTPQEARTQISAEVPTKLRLTPPISLDGRYELFEKTGQDSMGTTYRARRTLLNDEVTVRVLRPELINNQVALERFRRQAQVAARIKHPHSVQVFDFGYTAEGAAYIVEELLPPRTLRDLLNEERSLSLARVVSFFNQICGAVHTAHLNGIVLRDLKPETIYVAVNGAGVETVKVGAYGLAKIDEAFGQGARAQNLTGPLGVYGLPQYAAPEQLTNRSLDARADVYALGVILFEMLTGVLPFNADTVGELTALHIAAPVPDLAEFGRSDLSEDVAVVINRALAKEPEQRQASALHLAEELQAVTGAGRNLISKLTGLLPFTPVVVAQKQTAPAGEAVLPSVVPEVKETGRSAFNPIVLALMAEAFLSRLSSGLIKTAVPLYALLVFGMKITSVMLLVLIQNIVPLLLRPLFGSLADKYGKKRIFMISLAVRTLVGALYAVALQPALLFIISFIRGLADSAKGPSASAMIADHTDEKNIAQAYSWYTTTKSTSGGIGEALASFALVWLLIWFAGTQTAAVNVAVLDKTTRAGAPVEEIIKDPNQITVGAPLPGNEADPSAPLVARVEQREMRLSQVPLDDLPSVVDPAPLRRALTTIFIVSTLLSLASLILVAVLIKEKKKEKKDKKDKAAALTGQLDAAPKPPNVWAFALLGTALTAPAYMVTGEFFIILAVKLEVTPSALGWIKILAETITPLLFGPFFGWLADRIGAGRVIALRSLANLITSFMFWIVPWFAGTWLLGLLMGSARAIDEIGKAAFKPTWGAIAAKVSSFNLNARSRTMGILEGGVDASDLAFPVIAGAMLQYLSLGPLMLLRALLAIVAEVYGFLLMRKYKF